MNPRFEEFLSLSVRERLELLHAIVESLQAEEEETFGLTEAQERELDRRWRRHLRNPSAASTWEEVQETMRKRQGPFASPPKRERT